MTEGLKKLSAVFYRSLSGAEPVRDWLKELDQDDRRTVGYDIGKAEFGGQWGCRCVVPSVAGCGRSGATCRAGIARVIFCVAAGRMVLLHGFEKKSQRTPQPDLELARKRQKKVER